MNSSSGLDKVLRKSAGRADVAFAKAICSARIVFPVPGSPIKTLIEFAGRPPVSTSSSSGIPVRIRSTRAVSSFRLLPAAEETTNGLDQPIRVQRLAEKRVRTRLDRTVFRVEMAEDDHEDLPGRRVLPQPAAERQAVDLRTRISVTRRYGRSVRARSSAS